MKIEVLYFIDTVDKLFMKFRRRLYRCRHRRFQKKKRKTFKSSISSNRGILNGCARKSIIWTWTTTFDQFIVNVNLVIASSFFTPFLPCIFLIYSIFMTIDSYVFGLHWYYLIFKRLCIGNIKWGIPKILLQKVLWIKKSGEIFFLYGWLCSA